MCADVNETTVLFEEVEIPQEGCDGLVGRTMLGESSCAPRSTCLFHTTVLCRRLRAVSFIKKIGFAEVILNLARALEDDAPVSTVPALRFRFLERQLDRADKVWSRHTEQLRLCPNALTFWSTFEWRRGATREATPRINSISARAREFGSGRRHRSRSISETIREGVLKWVARKFPIFGGAGHRRTEEDTSHFILFRTYSGGIRDLS